MNIKLSKKYGVNPTIPVCFFCKQEKSEIALLGAIKDEHGTEIEAPRQMILDYEPCDECKPKLAQGVTIIETSLTPTGLPPIQETQSGPCYPNGKYAVMTEDAVKRIFSTENQKTILVEYPILTNLLNQSSEPNETRKD